MLTPRSVGRIVWSGSQWLWWWCSCCWCVSLGRSDGESDPIVTVVVVGGGSYVET